MRNSFQDIARRQVNADTAFVANLREQFGLTAEQAEHVFRVFRKCKAVKLVAATGLPRCVHGETFPCAQCQANRRWNEAATGKRLTEAEFEALYAATSHQEPHP